MISNLEHMKKEIRYRNNDITVVWKPDACIHSTLCWKGLIEVFNPKSRPWVKMEAATTERIIEQVRKCPSGALSYFINNERPDEPDKIVTGQASMVKVDVTQNGPYIINTECLIVHSDGKEETRSGKVALCRCGASANKPYCDGSHRKNGFTG